MDMKQIVACFILLGMGFAAMAQGAWENLHWKPGSPRLSASKTATHDDYPSECYHFDWSDSAAFWDTTGRSTYTYLSNGDLIDQVEETYDGQAFVPGSRYRNTYSAPGMVDSVIYYTYNGGNWDMETVFISEFDNQGNIVQSFSFGWNQSVWDTTWGQRTYYQYIFGNLIASEAIERWDLNSRNWKWTERYRYHYPTAAAWDTLTYFDYSTGAWEAVERYVDVNWYDFQRGLAYDMTLQVPNQLGMLVDAQRSRCHFSGNLNSTCVFDEWTGSSWDSTLRVIWNFDAQEHSILREEYAWIGTWYQDYGVSYQYTYDPQGRTLERIEEDFDGYIYRPSQRMTCPSFFTGEQEQQSLAASVTAFPIPCTDRLNLRWNQPAASPVEVTLTDAQGRLRVRTMAHASAGTTEIAVTLSDYLPAGIYVYTLKTRQGTASGKVLVQR